MKFVWISSIEALVIIFLPAILLFGLKQFPSGFQPPLEGILKVYKDTTISQSFVSSGDRLSGIGMSIRNFNLINKKDINLSLYQDDKLVRSSIINAANIEDGSLTKFSFEPIEGSKNQRFLFVLSAPTSTDLEALQPFYVEDKKMGSFKVKNTETAGSISFVTFHKPKSPLDLIVEVYSKWLRHFLVDLGFSIFFILLILSLSGYLIAHISTLLLE